MGLDYDSTVMLTCKLLFATAKSVVEVPGTYKLCLLDFHFSLAPMPPRIHLCHSYLVSLLLPLCYFNAFIMLVVFPRVISTGRYSAY